LALATITETPLEVGDGVKKNKKENPSLLSCPFWTQAQARVHVAFIKLLFTSKVVW
jgi:hypothetical protein